MRLITIMKYLGTLTALTAASGAYAANSGFYVGVDGGRDAGAIKTTEGSITSSYLDYANNADGFLWGASTGYNFFLTQRFVLGAELFWNRSNASVGWSHPNPAGKRDMEISSTIGASILPGWQLDSNNRLYARLGWIQGQFDEQSNDASIYGPNFDNKRSEGIQLGLGYLVNFANQWDLRMEYDHNDYRAIKQSGSDQEYTYKPEFDRYTLGVDYNFDSAQIKFADSVLLPISGWYAGVDAGRDDVNMNLLSTDNGATLMQVERSLRGYLGGLHVGYDWQVAQHCLLGVEAFGSVNSSYDEFYSTGYGVQSLAKLREEKSFGASVLPGYQLNQANLVYARIGYIESKFSETGAAGGLVGGDFSTHKPGLQLGLGYQVALTNAWSVFGEYDYADYAEIHTTADGDNYNYDPEDNQYKFGVNYHF
ncbi:MAG: porin family protein [Gammaproteobacteria bacterium]|nr:porin family protein [Gammaproteobacteria bacterium]